MKRVLVVFDYFAEPVRLNVRGKHKIPTISGTIVSLMLNLLLLSYALQ